MAIIESWFTQDLKEAVKVRYLDGNLFSKDNQGNKIGVVVYDEGSPATLSGTVTASILRSDGATVAVSGIIESGNRVSVNLPQAAYNIPGQISIVLKLTGTSEITTLLAVVANVYLSATDSLVDPDVILPSIDELMAEIENAVASIPAAGFANGSALNPNIFSVTDFENGSINGQTGASVSSSVRIRSKIFIPTTAKYYYSSNSNIRFMLYAWDKLGAYVGAWQTNGVFGTDAGSFATLDMTQFYTHPTYKDYRYKITIRMADGSVQVETVSGIYIDSLIYDIPANTGAVSVLKKAISCDSFDVGMFENGSIAYANGSLVSNSSRIRSEDFIPDTFSLFYSSDAYIRFNLYAWNESGTYVGAWYQGEFSTADVTPNSILNMSQIRSNANYRGYKYKIVILKTNGDVQIDNVSGVFVDSVVQRTAVLDTERDVLNLSNAYNINSAIIWENGGIRLSDGINVASASRARTRTVLPTNAGVIRFNSYTQYRGIFIAAYDLNGVYQGAYKSDGTFVKDGTETGFTTFDIQDLYRRFPGYRFRLAVYVRNSGPAVTPDEYEEWTITNGIYSKPSVLKVIQYNVGKFNRGFEHTTVKITDPQTKLVNYKEFFANENPDFLCMQECTQYFDTDDTMDTDSVLFNPFFFNKSWYEKETAIKSQFPLFKSSFSYLQTTGDNASWCVYGETYVDGKKIAIASGALNVQAPSGVDHSEQQIRALTKLVEGDLQGGLGFNFSNYDYAIICMDTNCLNQTEADTVKTFMAGKGYKTGNWDYLGNKDTYNPSSSDYKAIDNVFVKGNARITNFAVPSVYDELSSDHFPVIAEIRLT